MKPTEQPGFFDAPPVVDITASPTLAPRRVPVPTAANTSVPKEAKSRIDGQRRAILDALRRGKVNVEELKSIAAQYTARIFELREAGYVIENDHDRQTGESWYELKSSPTPVAPGVTTSTKRSRRGYRRRR